MKLVWTERALKHLDKIYAHHLSLTYSERAASLLYNHILDESERLLIFPLLGIVESNLCNANIEYRSLVVHGGRFKLIYFIDNENIVIAALWNCRMNPDSMSDVIA